MTEPTVGSRQSLDWEYDYSKLYHSGNRCIARRSCYSTTANEDCVPACGSGGVGGGNR